MLLLQIITYLLKKNISAFSIINPKQLNCVYPFKELSASGIALKLVQGMEKFKSKNLLKIMMQLV